MKFYNIQKIKEFFLELKRKKAEGISVFTSLKRMLIFFILYILITIVVAMIVIFSQVANYKIVTVPNVVNMEFHNAYSELHKLGLNVDIELKHFNNVEQGRVAFQSISPLKKVKQGRRINLVVSLGAASEQVTVETQKETLMRSYVLLFKLPSNYEKSRVQIFITDETVKDKLVFDNIVSSNEEIRLPLKIYGNGIEKIFINENLYLEKPIE